jgi:hypothetical protein
MKTLHHDNIDWVPKSELEKRDHDVEQLNEKNKELEKMVRELSGCDEIYYK